MATGALVQTDPACAHGLSVSQSIQNLEQTDLGISMPQLAHQRRPPRWRRPRRNPGCPCAATAQPHVQMRSPAKIVSRALCCGMPVCSSRRAGQNSRALDASKQLRTVTALEVCPRRGTPRTPAERGGGRCAASTPCSEGAPRTSALSLGSNYLKRQLCVSILVCSIKNGKSVRVGNRCPALLAAAEQLCHICRHTTNTSALTVCV
jgi:hypothetical protein